MSIRSMPAVLGLIIASAASTGSPWGPAGSPTGAYAGTPAAPATAPAAWWETQTAMDGGKISLGTRTWYAAARGLALDTGLALDATGDGHPDMLVRRERHLSRSGQPDGQSMLVWIVDDDGDMFASGAALGVQALSALGAREDRDSDCYLADRDDDGFIDRVVDYLDNDGDQRADEMEIRYFTGGELRRAWFWEDRDHDGRMWSLRNYEYDGNGFAIDANGDNLLFLNKYDPGGDRWLPFSECPFAFYDLDSDSLSETVVRMSAVPLAVDLTTDPDYANNARNHDGPFDPAMRAMGIANVRLSWDIDGGSTPAHPRHYDFGFTLAGRLPYVFPGMVRENPRRRAPKAAVCIPWQDVRGIAETYPARETGFSWREFGDDSIALGALPHPDDDHRWEGVFWTWDRQPIANTGNPTQRWNMRREYSAVPDSARQLYYSAIDRRIHLRGAREGWIEIGHIGATGKLGEIRCFDTDGNGYFDRWEYFRDEATAPYRVATVRDERATPVAFEFASLGRFYTARVADAIRVDRMLIAACSAIAPSEAPAALAGALTRAESPAEQRYLLDLQREAGFVAARARLGARTTTLDALARDARRRTPDSPASRAASRRHWDFALALERLDVAYDEGRDEEVLALLAQLGSDREP